MTRVAFAVFLVFAVAALSVQTVRLRPSQVITVATEAKASDVPAFWPPRPDAVKPTPTSGKSRKSMRPQIEPEEPARLRSWTIKVSNPENKVRDLFWDEARNRLMHDLNLSVLPTREFMENNDWLKRTNENTEKGKEVIAGVPMWDLSADLELTLDGWRELALYEQRWLAHERTEFTARVLAILTVLLGTVAGYIRLDEWTKGYYTGRLRLAAVLLVAVAGALVIA